MILINTTAPALIDATAWHGRDFLRVNSNLCTFSTALSAEYGLSYDHKQFTNSSSPISALRTYMQNVILQGPDLDPQTLAMHVDRILSLPQSMVQPLVLEISNNLDIASGSGNGFPPESFLNKLARMLNTCNSPCNYFKPVGDVVGLLASSTQMNTNSVAPAWDSGSTLLHAPVGVAQATFNKISMTAQKLLVGTAQAAKSIMSNALQPLFSSSRKSTETSLMQNGQSMSFVSHGTYLATDPFPYFQTQNNASNILARAKGSLFDCFSQHEYKYRYNPLDANMNLAVATNAHIVAVSEGSTYVLNVFGKPKVPLIKPRKMSIAEALDYKASNYVWDDGENRTLYPTTGSKSTEPKSPPTPTNANRAPGTANVAGSKVTDYGRPTDPYLDTNSKNGIGVAGIGEDGKGPSGLKGGNYLLKDYSMAVSPDVETQMRSNGISVGDWVQVNTADGQSFTKRWDDRTSADLSGRVDFYSPVGQAAGLDSQVVTITPLSGPPAGYIQPPRYVNGQAVN